MISPLALLAFYGSPLVVLLLFRFLPRPQALAVTIVGGYLFLPNGIGFDLPLVPMVDKDAVPVLAAALALALGLGRRTAPGGPDRADPSGLPPASGRRAGSRIIVALVVLMFLSPLVTILTNTDPVFAGSRVLQALRPYDGFSIMGGLLITLLPFLLAHRYLRSPEDHAVLLKVLAVLALAYMIPTLWEIRMSPQLHRQVYGFTPFNFREQIRNGGWRPVVFVPHGLWLAIFMTMGTLAAAAIWRHAKARAKWALATGALFLTLFLSNSLGALIVAILLLPVALVMGTRGQLIAAGAIALAVLLFPAMRGADLVPTGKAVDLASMISPERAGSLNYRFKNEDILLARAAEKPLGGWGGWGRSRVYDSQGNDISVTDGAWIIVIGSHGWLGYIARFGLLCLPIVLLMWERRSLNLTLGTAGLAVVLAANLADLIPNGTLTPVTWLVGGALAGRYALGPVRPPDETEAGGEPAPGGDPAGRKRSPRYSRFPVRTARDQAG